MHNKGGLMWGVMLILLGALLLLSRMGLLPGNVWAIFWPLALILWGLSLLARGFGRRSALETRQLAFQLKGYEEAAVGVHFRAGRLTLDSGAAPDELLAGEFTGGVTHELEPDGDVARVTLRTPPDKHSRDDLDWDIALNDAIPTALDLHIGASDTVIDLEHTHVTSFTMRAGAGKTEITLPAAAGETDVQISGGAGSIIIHIPAGVAAQIEGVAAAGRLVIDNERFPRGGSAHRSADYETAANRARINVRIGAGEVRVV